MNTNQTPSKENGGNTHSVLPINQNQNSFDVSEGPISFEQEMKEVSVLAEKLNGLLKQYKSLLTTEGAANKLKLLQQWSETYHTGLSAAQALSANANEWINDISERTRLAAEEVHRLENEGGPPPTEEQANKAEALLKASHKFNQMASKIDEKFGSDDKTPLISNT